MPGEFPKLMWQRENNSIWTLYSYDEMCIINKAMEKRQKTVSLPSTDPKKKIIINFEKMMQKNSESGCEQRIRCMLFNNSFFCWSWRDDYDTWICYIPYITVLLEVAYEKRLQKVDIFVKDDYEINLERFIQVNKETQNVHSIQREKVEVVYPKENVNSHVMMMNNDIACRDIVKKMAEEDIDRLQNYLFDSHAAIPGPSNVDFLPAASDEIITALSVEAQASTSTQNRTTFAVDPNCPEAKNYLVYCKDEDFYNATLNLTNLQDNINKYLILQLLKHHNRNEYAVWFHWGRVGFKGQYNLIKYGSNLGEAKSVFEKKFFEKTCNHWSERGNFVRVSAKYDLVHVHLEAEVIKPLLSRTETKLDVRIQNLLQIICNKKNLEAAAKELCYDSGNNPLGKMTARQILEGYDALNEISCIIKCKGKGKILADASNNFYTKVPHDFGRKTPPLLSTLDQVKEKFKMLEDLSNICLAMDLLSSSSYASGHIIDRYYRSLDCILIPLESTSIKFKVLSKCLLETHGRTHSAFTLELVDAFMCVKDDQELSFLDFGNKRLLWHGSRISNWLSIIKKGLRVAPFEAPSTGYMFGKGIYFTDVSSKSANYCFATKERNEGLLLLCEVSLGVALHATEADDFSNLPNGYHSVFGIGRIQPRSFETTVLSPVATVPYGPLVENFTEGAKLMYNEYIVYNVHQVKMKYLLRIRFNF